MGDEAARLGAQAAQELARIGSERLGPGLTEAEFDRVEREYGFEFAADHRAFLAACLPLNTPIVPQEGVFYTHASPWPDWRDGSPEELRKALSWPVSGVLFDVEHGHWEQDWGTRPQEMAEALAIAEERLAKVPQMIPVYGHRYLPGGRDSYGHPVLSIWQTDIITYGFDLVDYIRNEFADAGLDRTDPLRQPRVTVPYWREFFA